MTIYLRQSTASQEVVLGPFVDSTDGVTAETGLSIANTDIKVWKAGATTLANKNSGGGTHISGGIYSAVLDATDTDTLGSLKLFVAVSGALACVLECVVLSANVYDSLIGGGDTLDVQVTGIGSDVITAASIASDAGSEIGTAVWATATRSLTVLDEDSTTLDLDATIRAAVGLASANLDTQLDALPTAAENATQLLDVAAGVETNRTVRQSLRLMLAALAGKASGMATTTAVFRDTNDSKDRITATVDADGNRSAVTLDAS